MVGEGAGEAKRADLWTRMRSKTETQTLTLAQVSFHRSEMVCGHQGEEGRKGLYGKDKRVSSGKATGLLGEQKGNETVCDNICLCRCRWSCCLFYGHGIPLGKDMAAGFPEAAAVSDEGVSEKASFCSCEISNDFSLNSSFYRSVLLSDSTDRPGAGPQEQPGNEGRYVCMS